MLNPFRKTLPTGRKRAAPGFLRRLARDNRGNTLAMVGAAMVPLAGMIGSGLDMSRAYMAKNRLQSACDAASLAGRRVMTNDTLSQGVIDEATRFFNFNFPQGLYQTTAFTPSVTKPATSTVRVTASTTIPTTIMKLFGYTSLPLSVTCDASLNFVNTDIVLVLDTTGSMNDDVNGNSTSNDADRKITALRDAVLAFYDELKPIQDQLEAAHLRLRIGIVPFSITANVGAAIASASPTYLADSWTYPSRTAIYSTSSAPVRVGSSMNNTQCNAYVQARTPANSYPSTEKVVARPGSGTNRPCDVTTITYTEDTGATFAWWIHEPKVLDTSSYKTFSTSVPLPTRVPGTSTVATRWNGCIEERDTVDTITSSSDISTIPSGAYDLDIDMVPNSPETKWRPQWQQVLYYPLSGAQSTSNSNSYYLPGLLDANQKACPTQAKRLQAWTRDDLDTYLDTLTPLGYTYHDVGMIWGGRFISGGGIFGSDNPDTYNGMPVSRHIIYMTDGVLDTDPWAYSLYGIENIDQRITGGNGSQDSRHNTRFRMACNAVKGKKVSIWVIAFSTAATSTLNECASNTNQVSTISNRDALIAKFREIGKNIGSLRLTQ
jgi:Flp pilus assembly protein TadG